MTIEGFIKLIYTIKVIIELSRLYNIDISINIAVEEDYFYIYLFNFEIIDGRDNK